MARIAYMPTGGAALALNPKLLGDTVGVMSINQKPGRGDLRPWHTPLDVAAVPPGRKTIYRMGRDVASDALYWLSWSTVVHAIHGFISGDTTERTYYTGDGAPKVTDNILALADAPYPTARRDLGVPVPASALVVTPLNTGVSTTTEIRYYTYTYVTSWGEESAPASPSLEVTCKTDDTLSIANIEVPPAGSHGINRVRIYRTQTGTSGDTEFFFLREVLSSATSTTDDGRGLGEVMPTTGWLPPPATLSHLTAMWNGMAAAINTTDGSVRYCVAYKPYAWPIAYETLPPNARAVALATFGQSLLVLTNGRPVLVSGSSPESLDEQPIDVNQACIAPRSAVGVGHGVVWACPDGLAYLGAAGAKMLTAGILTQEDWRQLNPSSIVAACYEGAYFGFYEVGGVKKGFMIDPLQPSGIYFLEQGYDAVFLDESQDALFVLDGSAVRKWDAGAALMQAKARSKIFLSPLTNFAGARVEADAYPVQVHFDMLDLPAAEVTKVATERPAVFSAPDATTLRFTHSATSREPFRLPGDVNARAWQLEVETSTPVEAIVMASSLAELGGAG